MAAYLAFHNFKQLRVAVVGGGLAELAAAVALRCSGHLVEIYEPREFNVEVDAFIPESDVNTPDVKPILMNLVMREWEVRNDYKLEKRDEERENVYNIFHRRDIHTTLLKTATATEGKGTACKVLLDHICDSVDAAAGTVTFRNGVTVTADLIIGTDATMSVVRGPLGIIPDIRSAQPWKRWLQCKLCILGPMMPHQSQGARQALEDAAALGIIFSDKYAFIRNVTAGLELYQVIRKQSLTTEKLNEQIGFPAMDAPDADLAAAEGKLIDEMNGYDMHSHIAREVSRSKTRSGIQLSLMSNRLRNDRIIFGMLV
ncbi:hypothetical protein C8R44DRAFT_802603 [Mycena epipterygia]|nr:hypothetical protein C8R44DRAFT_802603 [Mycena epipterygia]